MHRSPPDRKIAGHAPWKVPWTTVSGSSDSLESERGSRKDAASTVLMLWPCVARIRKCDGSASVTESACAVALCWSSAETGASNTEVDGWSSPAAAVVAFSTPSDPDVVTGNVVPLVVDSFGCAEGIWRRANRFLSEESTAWRTSSKVTFRDLSFRHCSWECLVRKDQGEQNREAHLPRPRHLRSLGHSSSGLPFRLRVAKAGSGPWIFVHRDSSPPGHDHGHDPASLCHLWGRCPFWVFARNLSWGLRRVGGAGAKLGALKKLVVKVRQTCRMETPTLDKGK